MPLLTYVEKEVVFFVNFWSVSNLLEWRKLLYSRRNVTLTGWALFVENPISSTLWNSWQRLVLKWIPDNILQQHHVIIVFFLNNYVLQQWISTDNEGDCQRLLTFARAKLKYVINCICSQTSYKQVLCFFAKCAWLFIQL